MEILADIWILTRENPITMGVMLGALGFLLFVAGMLIWRRFN